LDFNWTHAQKNPFLVYKEDGLLSSFRRPHKLVAQTLIKIRTVNSIGLLQISSSGFEQDFSLFSSRPKNRGRNCFAADYKTKTETITPPTSTMEQ
jgi:hypothetical protein